MFDFINILNFKIWFVDARFLTLFFIKPVILIFEIFKTMDDGTEEYLLSIVTALGGFEIKDEEKQYIIGDECEGIHQIIISRLFKRFTLYFEKRKHSSIDETYGMEHIK